MPDRIWYRSGDAPEEKAPGRTLPAPIEIGTGRLAVRLEPVPQGRDLVLLITGGDAHVGAVAGSDGRSGVPVPPAAENLIQLPGHREGPLAAEAAAAIAVAAGCSCAAVVGIHQDRATPVEIAGIVANVRAGLARLAEVFRSEGSA